ncbi:uncharacterized protein LOC123506642 [Portunus trituberculatus]|uniref:uncharacterized protein LOC123506642 n=1 Tax=Portunus trituberculatus TaxID=210409 RepID=UPI001E1CE6A8|nr:uncharacterized protein LOC123506642 [Portunus trituberculatus]
MAQKTSCTVTTVLVTGEGLSAPFTTVFLSCMSENKWPSLWKEACVVPIHKKNLRYEPSNYRPISLLSVMGKVLEQIVTAAVYLNENHLLSVLPGLYTAHILLHYKDWWQDALEEALDTLVVPLDIVWAFNKV